MAGKGHPRKFETKEDFIGNFQKYIKSCVDKKRFPNIAGYCAWNLMTRETYYKQKEYYSDTYNITRDILEDEVLQDNSYRMQLYVKNVFGYKDKIETENTNKNINTNLEVEKLVKDKKAIKDLIERVETIEYDKTLKN